VFVGNSSLGNRFELSEFINPTGICLGVDTLNETYLYKSYFRSCLWDVNLVTSAPVTLDRSVANLAKVSKGVTIKFPGCTGDFDRDGSVDPNERGVVLAAMHSAIGDSHWNPEADLDHDGVVDDDDLAVFNGQVGPCAPNLVVTVLNNPPATTTPGRFVTVSDTVQNQSRIPAGPSRTQYYLSLDTVKGAGDKLLGGRAVPALGANATSAASLSLTIPTGMALGTYYILACADDTHLVAETDEAGNCRASTTTVRVGRPDLTISAVSNPSTAVPGFAFQVSDTVENQTAFSSGTSRTQYYLSVDGVRNTGDRLLSGNRAVPALAPGGASGGTASVVIPNGTPAGTYYFLACADDTRATPESDETNNCRTSTTQIRVGRPDLVVAVVKAPATAVRGTSIQVSETVQNQGAFNATATFRVHYYLSLDGLKNDGDRLLTGYRMVPGLAADASSPATTSVTIPAATLAGDYFLLVCADDTFLVSESVETNNCLPSAKVTVTP
jgi:subtilase family serine protease